MKTLITICLLKQTKYFLLLSASFIFLFTNAFAEIKYKLLDTTISETSLNQSQRYLLDMNGDGINEYFFNHGNQMGDIVCEIYSERTSFTNEILIENYVPSMLDYSSEISTISTEWKNTYNGVGSDALYFLDNWPGAINKYVAVRFKINNAYHYGWIGIEIPTDSTYIKINDCAYEDVAGQMIYAGYKGVDIVDEFNSTSNFISMTDNVLFININDFNNSEYLINIYDVNGNLRKSTILNNSYLTLDVSDLNSGPLFIILLNNKKCILREILIK